MRTVEGAIFHERAHNATAEKRGRLLVLRDLRIHSATLGISGACDVVEFHEDETGIALHGREGLWQPYPVEYKRGKPKEHLADELQLCAQAMCLEEMLCGTIPTGALYYGEPRRRQEVELTDSLRDTVRSMLEQMHDMARRNHTPKPGKGRRCNACSLKELCLPSLVRKQSVAQYIKEAVAEVSQCENY